MKWGQFFLCGWPGLAHLWLRGSYPALWLAIGFAVLLNLALVVTFLWPAVLGEAFPVLIWPVVCVVWLTSAASAWRMVPQLTGPPQMRCHQEPACPPEQKQRDTESSIGSATCGDVPDALFNQAQREYLRGNWTEATSLLRRRLDQSERDVEARLLLATLYRRSGQPHRAVAELKRMERFDDAIHWSFEIGRERELIARSQEELEADRSTGDTADEIGETETDD